MDHLFYKQQIERLKNQWPHAYSEERMVIFFNAFKDVANFDFRDAVTDLIANSKTAPLLKEITEAIVRAKNNYYQQKRIDEATQKGIFNSIPDGQTCDPEFKNKCMELYNSFMDKKITKKEFDQGCDLLDQAALLYKQNKQPTYSKLINKPYKVEEEEFS